MPTIANYVVREEEKKCACSLLSLYVNYRVGGVTEETGGSGYVGTRCTVEHSQEEETIHKGL